MLKSSSKPVKLETPQGCFSSSEAGIENDQVKLLWDFRIQTDHHFDHNRPDIVVLEKEGRWSLCSLPFWFTGSRKRKGQDRPLSRLKSRSAKDLELQKSICHPYCNWSTWSKHLKMWISKLGTPGIIALLQKACLLGTAKILRRTLDT